MRHRRTRPTTEPSKPRPGRDRRPRLPTLTALPKRLRTAAVPAGAGGTVAMPARSAAGVLASHVLRDGEAVLLILRPSLWFVPLASLRWLMSAAAMLAAAATWGGSHYRSWAEAAIAVAVGRLTVAAAQWVGRLYVLTDLRVVTIAGVARAEVTDCPLRKVARTRLVRSTADRGLGIGSVEIVPQDPEQPFAVWQQVARPVEVHERIVAALNRAKQGCCGE